jgi:hypothetical protein
MSYFIFHICCAVAAIYFASSGPRRSTVSFSLILICFMFGPLAAFLMWMLREDEIKKDEAGRCDDD